MIQTQESTVLLEQEDSIPDGTMRPELVKRKRSGNTKTSGRARQIVGLLRKLGVPNETLYVQRSRQRSASLWMRPLNHLQVLEQARQLYRRRILDEHPDKPGGSLERTIELNHTWSEIKKRFRKHGHELW